MCGRVHLGPLSPCVTVGDGWRDEAMLCSACGRRLTAAEIAEWCKIAERVTTLTVSILQWAEQFKRKTPP